MRIKQMLEQMFQLGASDLHIKAGIPPTVRINGKLRRLDSSPPTPKEIEETARQVLTPLQRERFERTREIDFAFGVTGLARFRANFYVQRNTIAMVYRHVPVTIRSVEELNLPSVIGDMALQPRGLILVTGTVGSGKSTTLAAMVKKINQSLNASIITIEDPIEFLHRDEKSIVNQREVGTDTTSYHEALRHILRQDPDVILIGEIRDRETMEIALKAADTGHLVLSTLHTIDATETVNRIIAVFPPYQHKQVRMQLSSVLKAIISMRLMPRADGKGRVPAVEVLIATATIKDCILDPDKTKSIQDVIEQGAIHYSMQTFDQSLFSLYKTGLITYEEALRRASNPDDFVLKVKGIQSTSELSIEEQLAIRPEKED